MQISKEDASHFRKRGGRGEHDYPDTEVETERGVPHSIRRRLKIVAALKLPKPRELMYHPAMTC